MTDSFAHLELPTKGWNGMTTWGHLEERYGTERPRKLLSIDGGGLRGIMTLEILRSMEAMLARETKKGDSFRMCDYFDYIAGTSTGSVVATCLALGKTVDEVQKFYLELGPKVFAPDSLIMGQNNPAFHPFQDILQDLFGAETDLASEKLRTLLMVVLHNNTTDSAWPLSSNPFAKYNDPTSPGSNLHIPLWQLVRASTAYPGVFPPEVVTLDGKEMQFDDGGVSPYINPAFQLFKMASAPEYRLGWKTGERNMLIVSCGTGTAPHAGYDIYASQLTGDDGDTRAVALQKFVDVVMYGAQVDQDMNCRTVGRCSYGDPIDSEIGDMIPRQNRTAGESAGDPIPLSEDLGKSFLYARYDVLLNKKNLERLDLGDINAEAVQSVAALEQIENFKISGAGVGDIISREHFGPFLD
jgi:hypothetical protein